MACGAQDLVIFMSFFQWQTLRLPLRLALARARAPGPCWDVINPRAGPAESDSESDNESLPGPDSPAGQGWGSDLGQTDEEDDPGECMVCKKNEQYPIK